MSAGTVGGFRAREEAAKAERERQRQAEASRRAQQSEAGKAAHREAVLEAYKRGKEQDGTQRITVRTDYSADTASTTIKEKSGGRSSSRDRRQFGQSGEPVNLQGDPRAIQEVRARSFQQAREKAARSGGKVDEAAVNRETRNILAQSRGRVSIIDENARRDAITEGYRQLKGEKKILQSDGVYLTPVQGIRSRSVFEGRREDGGIETVTFTGSKSKTLEIRGKPVENDPIAGFAAPFYNIGEGVRFAVTDLFGGRKVPRFSYDTKTGFITSKSGMPDFRPEAEGSLIGAGIESGKSAFQGKPTISPFERVVGDFRSSPLYYGGSAFGSAAIYATPFGVSKLLARFVPGVAKAATRARFDYSPQYGSFADRESIRFTHFQPTRWENPEMLAELSKFKMSIDLPKAAKIAPLATVRTAEAFERVRNRQDPIIRTSGGNLVLKVEPMSAPSKVESASQQIIKQQTKAASAPASSSSVNKLLGLGGGAGLFTSKEPLGFMGATGAGRRRRRDESTFTTEFEKLSLPPASLSVFERMSRMGSASGFLAGQRSMTSQFSNLGFKLGQTGRQDLFQRSNLTNLLKTAQTTSTVQATLTAQLTKQLTGLITGQTTRITQPPKTPPWTPLVPPFVFPLLSAGERKRKKKGKKGGGTRAAPREGWIKDLISATLGENAKIARDFRRLYGSRF